MVVVRSALSRDKIRVLLVAILAFALMGLLAASAVGALTLKLPKGVSRSFANRIYGEQLDSQESIRLLVGGKVTSFEVTSRAVGSTSATLTARVRFTDGTSRRGVFKMKKTGGKWYLAGLRRTTTVNDVVPIDATPDIGVLNTLLSEQSIHSTVTDKLVRGTYSKVSVGKPVKGYRSAVMPIVLRGPGVSAKGGITCVQRFEQGKALWFVVSFWQ